MAEDSDRLIECQWLLQHDEKNPIYCKETFETTKDLGDHVRGMHVSFLPEKKCCCYWMNCKRGLRTFPLKCNLLEHLRRHIKEKDYKCPYEGCDQKFVWSACVRRHIKKDHSLTELELQYMNSEEVVISPKIKGK